MYTPDILVTVRGGGMLAVVVQNMAGWTVPDAVAYVTDVFADDGWPNARFLMLLSQDQAIVWRVHPDDPAAPLELVTVADVSRVFADRRYGGRVRHDGERLSGDTLSTVAYLWLGDVAAGLASGDAMPPDLVRAGVLPALNRGLVSMPDEVY